MLGEGLRTTSRYRTGCVYSPVQPSGHGFSSLALSTSMSLKQAERPSHGLGAPSAPALLPHRVLSPPPTTRSDHTFKLSDGRTLSYALYGPTDGRPVFFLHGLPSCRLEAEGLSLSGLLHQTGTRLIVPDRPAFGHSSPSSGRTIMTYVDDLEALSLHLSLDEAGSRCKYAIIGGSGGGPYATACAFVASQTPNRFRNMHKVGLFAAAPPYVSPFPSASASADSAFLRRDWMLKSRVMFGSAKYIPNISRRLTSASLAFCAWLWHTRWGRKKIEEYLVAFLSRHSDSTEPKEGYKQGRKSSTLLLADEASSLIALSKDTWRQGPDGWLDEIRLLGAPWGFDPAAIRCAPMGTISFKIWHGARDVNAPLSAMKWLADRISGSDLVVIEDKGHFGMSESLRDMLEWAGRREAAVTSSRLRQ